MLQAFYHVWEQNHWREVLLEHFRILQRQKFQGKLTIGFIGNPYTEGFVHHMLETFQLDGTVELLGPDSSQYEFPTLKLLQEAARESPGDQFLYFHSKGVSRPNDWVTCNWRWYMNAFVVGQLINLLPQLTNHDLAGASWGNNFNIGGHFPGNYWLARGDYLAALPDIDQHREDATAWLELPEVKRHSFLSLRHAAENWSGKGNPRIYDCAHEQAQIWDHGYWVRNLELQKFVAREGTA